MIICAKCAAYNRPAANFCWQCGYPRHGAVTQPLSWDAIRASLDHYLALSLGEIPEEIQAVLQPILDFRSVLWRDELQVTFLGMFKSGKSTLLNALMGADILPTRVLHATGSVTRISYAPQPCAYVIHTTSQGSSHKQQIAFDERAAYILLDIESPHALPASRSFSSSPLPASPLRGNSPDTPQPDTEHYESVDLGIPLSLLEHGCVLVDTPGLMDDITLTLRSEQELMRTDLAVLVLSAYQLLSLREKEVARNAHRLLQGNVVFVINQMDTVAVEDQADVIERAHLVLRGIGNPRVGQPRIFATVALYTDSLLAYEQWFTELLQSETRQQIIRESRLGILSRLLGHASEVIDTQLKLARQTTRQACEAAAVAQVEQQKRLRLALKEDELRLNRLANRLDSLGEAFVAACVVTIDRLMQTDQQWHTKLRLCLQRELQSYMQRITQGARAALTNTGLDIPVFDLYQTDIRAQLLEAESWVASAGFWANFTPDFQISIPILSTIIQETIGPLVDDIAKQTRLEAQYQSLRSIEQTTRQLLPALRRESQNYLETVRAQLQAVEHLPTTDLSALQALETAHRVEQMYSYLADWCSQFQATIASIQQFCATDHI